MHRQHSITMIEHIEILKQTSLFYGIKMEEIEKILKCMYARFVEFEKDEMIICEGSEINDIGILLSGYGRSIKQDESGKTSIITLLKPGSFIGILLAASKNRKSPVSVQAQEHLSVLFIPIENFISGYINDCPKYNVLLRNYIDAIAEKAMILHDRNDCLIKSSVREKVLSYLKRVAKEEGSNTFTTPFDRNDMAEYVNVERSALSRELSRMKKDGIIDYYKNSFKLL
ncbi:cAMP-binding domain of CRP or a regulatory subunit of cAMP-dependent protein kinases [Clostridium acidisoli DSM 12555]|uniref:cAMP-binding domain of CRP or a regulatory subunit of cAMP-dependent protein kinases n=2 Tax=Clostridium TaxID=1485 RepID=A0A1W1XHU2_9CLOT|nr:cAMP-binding domain of CRP or a regulatory subunit of cAMP-dependent protein kinases [Clostridium acidisoli DSM 12555]